MTPIGGGERVRAWDGSQERGWESPAPALATLSLLVNAPGSRAFEASGTGTGLSCIKDKSRTVTFVGG